MVCLTLCIAMEFPIKFDTVKSGWPIIYIEGSQVINITIYFIPFSEDNFVLANSADPDEIHIYWYIVNIKV